MISTTPIPFEVDFPEEAQVFMDICQGREKGQCMPIVLDYHPSHPYSIENVVGIPIIKEEKTGRNDPCPCNSGKKFKKCCGR